MEQGFKVTTHGRAILTACMDTGAAFEITRVAFGSGRVSEETDLADVHEPVKYEADGTITSRRHEDNILYLTASYANSMNPDKETFYIAEFMLYATNPDTGEETDAVYCTLGDYIQPVPAYSSGQPAAISEYPIRMVVSNDTEVTINVPVDAYLTFDDAEELMEACLKRAVGMSAVSFTIQASDWTEENVAEVAVTGVEETQYPIVMLDDKGVETARWCGLSPVAETLAGAIRFRTEAKPSEDISGVCLLFTEGAGGGAALSVASSTTLGGVKVQDDSGLSVDSEGNLSLNAATSDEVDAIFTEE